MPDLGVEVRVTKIIKPSRFKAAEMQRVLRNAMRRDVKVLRKDFEATTKTWEHKPVFKEHTRLSQSETSPSISVDTDDAIYTYVVKGTKAHMIWAGIYTGKSKKRVLAFPSKFRPKTKVRVIGSFQGSRGGPTLFRPYVNHPGTKAREFDVVIKAKREPWFKKQMEAAMRDAAKASGHAL